MRRSKAEIYLHLIWATKDRQPLLTPALQKQIYSCLRTEAAHLRCQVLALGGISDHVHLALRVPTTVCPAQIMKQIKGASSAFANDLIQRTPYFRWQEGYGVFSFGRSSLQEVIAYIENQEQHHRYGTVDEEWEEVDEAVPE